MRLRLARRWLVVAATFVVAFTAWLGLLHAAAWLEDPRDFDGVSWELAAFPQKWLHALGASLRDDPPADEAIRAYFALAERDSDEARRLERTVEAAIEGRLDAVLQAEGFAALPGVSAWPPVAIELTEPPRMLAVSPRDRIRLARTQPLGALATSEAASLEEEVEASSPHERAVVVPLGGISTYPAIVTTSSTYAGTVQVAAHEWVHHAFGFAPLGWVTLVSREALAINETAADIAGAELATQVLTRFGDPTLPPAAGSEDDRATESRDARSARAVRDAALRDLRREVDVLLADGRVDAAEARMEAVRRDLEASGLPIRRLNQAFFAWYGTYAARGDSVDSLGAQLRQLRGASESLPAFLATVGRTTSRQAVADAVRARGLEPAAAPR